ncbi:TPA: glycosyltransferase family 2 protein [Candidatus Acetothermia bacterium]|nr:glycosyltransferase family 2 protein [Candidatus Acetothermia bacterium]
MGKPTVTVVVPVLNEEEFLEETLRSLRAQTFTDFELLVVDNGSTDRSPEIARGFTDRVLCEPRRGSAWAMHRGFSEATGVIIVSADADTIYPPQWLERMVKELGRDGVVAVYGPMGLHDAQQSSRAFAVVGYTLFAVLSRALGVHQVGAANFGMRRDAYCAAGGYPPLARLASPDLRLALRLKRLGKVRFVSRLVCYTSGRRFAHGSALGEVARVGRCWLDVVRRREEITSDEYWAGRPPESGKRLRRGRARLVDGEKSCPRGFRLIAPGLVGLLWSRRNRR